MRIRKDSTTLLLALLLNAITWACITISRTYVDLLFLSTYEVDKLPYLFLGQTVLIILTTLLLSPLSAKNSLLINSTIYLVAGLSMLNGAIFLEAEIKGFAFGFSLWLSTVAVVLTVVTLNIIVDAFDVRRFKKLVMGITAAGSLGGLGMGLLIPPIISRYGTDFLLYTALVLLLIAASIAPLLKSQPTAAKPSTHGQSPFNYALFRNVALCTFLLMLVDTFTDYALKSELGRTYSTQEEIGRFMGPLYGISNILTLVLQLGGARPLLKFAGVAGLMAATPWFAGIAGAALLYMPTLLGAALLRVGQQAFRFSFFSIGREIALKPLPVRIRRAGKFMIIAAGYLGAGVGSLTLIAWNKELSLTMVSIFLVVICALWLISVRHLGRIYQDTLEDAIRIKRFNLNDDYLGEEKNNILDVSRVAFQDQDPDSVRFGFTLLKKAELSKMPESAYPHLNSNYSDIRVEFLNAASQFKDESVVPMLLERLKIEADGKVLWWLLKTLAELNSDEVVDEAARLLPSLDPLVRAGAVLVLMKGGSLEQIITAATTLNNMLKSSDASMRKGAAYAISALNLGKMEKELQTLLYDTNEVVCIAAMWAVANQRNTTLIKALVAKLGHGRASHYAGRTLKQIGPPVIPYLTALIQATGRSGRQQGAERAAVRILVSFYGEEADRAILTVAQKGSVLARTLMAKECAMRARRSANSDVLVREAGDLVTQEAHNIRILKTAQEASFLQEPARLEIAQRRQMAEARLLYWLNVKVKSDELLGVIPSLLNQNTVQDPAARYATALEFLDTVTGRNKHLKQALAVFEEAPGSMMDTYTAVQSLGELEDVWLNEVLEIGRLDYNGSDMDITHKVILLRKVKLFRDLPGEILLTIAETCEAREMIKGELLFSQGDLPDGMYIVASGKVGIKKGKQLLTELHENDFFGELGLFDDSPRKADAVALTDGMVLFLEKEVFDGITEDLPEVLRALVRTVIGYLK